MDKKRNGPTMGLNGLDRRSVYGNHPSAEGAEENHENGEVRMRVKKVYLLNTFSLIAKMIPQGILFIEWRRREKAFEMPAVIS